MTLEELIATLTAAKDRAEKAEAAAGQFRTALQVIADKIGACPVQWEVAIGKQGLDGTLIREAAELRTRADQAEAKVMELVKAVKLERACVVEYKGLHAAAEAKAAELRTEAARLNAGWHEANGRALEVGLELDARVQHLESEKVDERKYLETVIRDGQRSATRVAVAGRE